jgi:hypothetical protein
MSQPTRPPLGRGDRPCTACPVGLVHPPPAPPLCDSCSAVHVPDYSQWPRELVPWLIGRHIGGMMAVYPESHHAGYVHLLRSTTSAHRWGSRILSHAASDLECFTVATTEAARWMAAGKPRLFGPSSTPTREGQ